MLSPTSSTTATRQLCLEVKLKRERETIKYRKRKMEVKLTEEEGCGLSLTGGGLLLKGGLY